MPTLVFGFHGLRYDVFDHLRGVEILEGKQDLSTRLEALLHDEVLYADRVRALAAEGKTLSPFDGHCLERILDLITESDTYGA